MTILVRYLKPTHVIWPDRRATRDRIRGPQSNQTKTLRYLQSSSHSLHSPLHLPTMLPGSTLELTWDYEIENSLEPSLSISYTGSSALFFSPSPSQYNFSVSHRTYSRDVSPHPHTRTDV